MDVITSKRVAETLHLIVHDVACRMLFDVVMNRLHMQASSGVSNPANAISSEFESHPMSHAETLSAVRSSRSSRRMQNTFPDPAAPPDAPVNDNDSTPVNEGNDGNEGREGAGLLS